MTTLHLIRHGETASNAGARFQGQHDVPLNDRGRRQAEALAAALAGWDLDAIVTSDLSRAADTAAAVAEPRGLVPVRDPRWREIDVGEWAHHTVTEVRERWSDLYARWRAGERHARLPGGESLDDLLARAAAATQALVAEHPGEVVAVVSHGLSLRAAIAHALGVGPEILSRIRLDNCSVSTLELRPGHPPVLCRLNEQTLPPELAASAPDVGMAGVESRSGAV